MRLHGICVYVRQEILEPAEKWEKEGEKGSLSRGSGVDEYSRV